MDPTKRKTLLKKIKTEPIKNTIIPKTERSRYENLDVSHLFSSAFMGDCLKTVAKAERKRNVKTEITFNDFSRVVELPGGRGAPESLMGLFNGSWYEIDNASHYVRNPNERIAIRDVMGRFDDPKEAWRHYSGYFVEERKKRFAPKDFEVTEEDMKYAEEAVKRVKNRNVPPEIAELGEKGIKEYVKRLRRYKDMELIDGKFSAVVDRWNACVGLMSFPDKAGIFIGKGGDRAKIESRNNGVKFIQILHRVGPGEIKRIVSHAGPRHMDDFLAIALLKAKSPDAEILFEKHDSPDVKKRLSDPYTAVVDVGREFNPLLFNYDHHQDRDVYPCSAVLVLADAYEAPNVNSLSLATIDCIDRFGYEEARKRFGYDINSKDREKSKIAMLSDLSDPVTVKIAADTVVHFVEEDPSADLTEFIDALFSNLLEAGKLEKAVKLYESNRRNVMEFTRRNGKITTVKGKEVAYFPFSLAKGRMKAEIFACVETDLIVERSLVNPTRTMVSKNVFKPNDDVDLGTLSAVYPVAKEFPHKIVLDVPIERFDLDSLSKCVADPNPDGEREASVGKNRFSAWSPGESG